MPNTVKQGIALMKSAAQTIRGYDAHGRIQAWPGWCQSAATRFAGAPGGYDTAGDCYAASRILSTDPATAPAGCFHFWTDSGAGHVAVSLGRRRTFMASSWVTKANGGRVWHTGLGDVDVAAYTRAKPSLRYRGWSYDLGGSVMAGVTVAVKVPGDVRIWLLTPDLTRRHLTKPEWAKLRLRGVRATRTTTGLLAQFPIA